MNKGVAIITVEWGDDLHTVTLTLPNWSKVKGGEPLRVRGNGYRFEGEFFWDHWEFGGGLDGSLRVTYGEGVNEGVGFEGKLRDATIEEVGGTPANEPSHLHAIQTHFHAVIMERAGPLVREQKLELPKLEDLLTDSKGEAWFPVPGMYGGFSYRLEGAGAKSKLICESWSRVVGGSGQRHEITPSGATLVAEGFV